MSLLIPGNGLGREPFIIYYFPTSHPIAACYQRALYSTLHYIINNTIVDYALSEELTLSSDGFRLILRF